MPRPPTLAGPTRLSFPSRQILLETLDMSGQAVLILDVRGENCPIAYANSASARLLGRSIAALTGEPWDLLDSDDGAARHLRESIRKHEACEALLNGQGPDGSNRRLRAQVHALRSSKDGCDGMLILLDDAPEDRAEPEATAEREKVRAMTRTESKSGLMHFDDFTSRLERDLAIARRQSLELCLIVLDISEFDVYRETFGTNSADSCMRMIARQMTSVLRRGSDMSAQLDDSRLIAALIGQGTDEVIALAEQICRNIVGLRLHNPHGRSGRFLSAVPRVFPADVEHEDIDALLARVCDSPNDAAMLGCVGQSE